MIKSVLFFELCLFFVVGCTCSPGDPLIVPIPSQSYCNLAIIDIGVEGAGPFSFEFNGEKLTQDGDLYSSKDLFIYQGQHSANK